jgi:hypothetical protein
MNNSLGECKKCGVIIGDNNLGGEFDIGLLCKGCADIEVTEIITNLKDFVKSEKMNNWIDVRNKILWLSERMGYWYDSGTGIYIESVGDYDDWSLIELQDGIKDNLITLEENMAREEILVKSFEEKF